MSDADLTAPLVEKAATARGAVAGVGLRPGTSLGRYVIVERLGAGTGGTVYAAFDSHLSRKVAVKVLHTSEDEDVALSPALLREAQLIAALDHPNIVTVHDIGQANGHTFIAMELVVGSDFAAWLRRHGAEPRAWRQRLAPWLLAGRGLAAAHAGGVIHGDFKPANVLLGDDGRVRVTDFGVARLRESDRSEDEVPDDAPEKHLWGTPLYMAPELFDGRAPDERSDVFAFAASVYEAIYGAPPIEADGDLVTAKQRVPTPNDPRGVPARVLEVLRRGLLPDPAQRIDSVAALVDALERTTRSRGKIGLVAAGVVGLATAAIVAIVFADDDRRCAEASARLDGVWDASRRTAAQEAFVASGLPYADTAWRRFSVAVDRYAADWIATYTDVCRAADDERLDAAMSCLARRRVGLVALVDGIAGGPASRIGNAADAADALAPVASCRDLETNADLPTPARDIATEVDAIDELIAAAKTNVMLADGAAAFDLAAEAHARALAVDFPPLLARAEAILGHAKSGQGDYAGGVEMLEHAALLAEEVGDDETAAEAGLSLMYARGIGLDDAEAALAWAPHVEIALKRGHKDARAWSTFHDYRALTLVDLGRTDEAATALERAIEAWRTIESDTAAGEIAEREAELRHLRGDLEGAIAKQREAARLLEDALGWPEPAAVVALSDLAAYLQERGDMDESIIAYERTVDGARASLGVDHPMTLSAAANFADALSVAGRFEESLDQYAAVREGFARSVGIEHPRYAGVLSNMAATMGKAGRHAEALELAERSLGPLQEHFGPEHRIIGYVYRTIGMAKRRTGDAAGAVEALERSLAIHIANHERELELAELQFELAVALAEAGRDRDRVHDLARAAQKTWNSAGAFDRVAEIAALLQTN